MTYDLSKLENKKAIGVGYVSLVGIMTQGVKFPLDWGNYFSLQTEDGCEYEMANFWYENLEHLIKSGEVAFPIQIKVLEKGWGLIYDNRVSEEYCTDISYRAPEKYWSATKRANRQLKIDIGELQIIKCDNGMVFEKIQIKAKSKSIPMNMTVESKMDFMGSFEGESKNDPGFIYAPYEIINKNPKGKK